MLYTKSMKLLSGLELVDFIKVRQLKQVRGLRQAERLVPRLAIVCCGDTSSVIEVYVRHKKAYAKDILIEVDEYREAADTIADRLRQLADDDAVQGIILQLPITPAERTDELLQLIPAHKDVDGLTSCSQFTPATPMAITWLLHGYGVALQDKKIALVGNGRLVGAPLAELWQEAGYSVSVFEKDDGYDLAKELPRYEIIVSATGIPSLITSEMVAPGAVVVDAGTASEDGVIKGDVAASVRQRTDIAITPEKGGVGPLTIAALFDNVITATRNQATRRHAEEASHKAN